MKTATYKGRAMWCTLVNEGFIPALLVVVAAAFFLSSPLSFTVPHIETILRGSANLLIAVSGLIIIMASGGVDLSIGGQLSLVVAVMGLFPAERVSLVGMLLIGLLAGAVCGSVNGFLVSRFGITPFAVTFVTNYVFVAAAKFLSESGDGFVPPEALKRVMEMGLPILRVDVMIAIVCLVITMLLLRQTFFGRYVVAIGINETVSRRTGVRVARIKWSCYVIGGVFFALAAIVLSTGEPVGTEFANARLTLSALTAVCLGSMILLRDKNRTAHVNVWKVALAALLVELVNDWVIQVSQKTHVAQLVICVMLLAALVADRIDRKPLKEKNE